MTILLLLAALTLLALLAPRYGVDSRNLDGRDSQRDKLWSRAG